MLPLVCAWLTLAAVAAPAPSAPPQAAAAAVPVRIADDGDRDSLLTALARTRTYLAGLKGPSLKLVDREIPLDRARRSLDRFAALVESGWGTPGFEAALRDEFEWVAMPGQDGAGSVHFTGYHLPQLEAREKPDATFRFPLYAPPADLVSADLGAFRAALSGTTLTGRIQAGRLVPYYDRAAIDDGQALAGRGLEIAWVADELARYQLMVQGSGLLRFADGRVVNVNYAGQNGQPYVSLGKAMIADGKIPAEQISMPAIEAYFKARPNELHGMLNRNPSYVFFTLQPQGPFGSSGISLVAGRAIATDKRLFPAGLLAYVEYPRARFDGDQLTAWEPGSRFVIDQDTGGAILGPGRVDLYLGGGPEAARQAGTLNGRGKAYFLLLKAPGRP